MDLPVILLLALLGLFLASVLALLTYGRFAKPSRGSDSFAFDLGPPTTRLDHAVAEKVARGCGSSGLALVSESLDAFALRALTAREAGRSLDLMYYYWKDDLTGRLMAREIVEAAEKGVRVRLLIDDINTRGLDRSYLALDADPNIEVRLFNPSRARELGIRRGMELLLRAFTINRRMHGKAWIADGRLAIVGGRNIGDEYFDAGKDANFRDLDLALVGPVVRQVEEVFDRFWNSEMTVPIRVLLRRPEIRLDRLRRSQAALVKAANAQPYLERVLQHGTTSGLLDSGPETHWTHHATIVSDPPEKAAGRNIDNWMMKKLMPVLASADRSVSITSPYFVPGVEGARGLNRLVAAGIDVAVLTNSLAATDVAAVHGGYARYRKSLLAGGVKLYELQPYLARGRISLFGSRAASLHTKAFAVDGATGFVGSFNFDPRSASLNTEMGVLFFAPELVAEMEAIFREETSPQMSWRLRLGEGERLVWEGERDGHLDTLTEEPLASRRRRAVAAIVGWLPVESQL